MLDQRNQARRLQVEAVDVDVHEVLRGDGVTWACLDVDVDVQEEHGEDDEDLRFFYII